MAGPYRRGPTVHAGPTPCRSGWVRLSALPPVRRRLVLGVLAVLVAAVLVAVVLVVVNRTGSSSVAAEPVDQSRPGPVLLAPGYGGATSALDTLATRLRAAGRDATVIRLPGDGTGELRDQAKVLDAAARAELAGGAPSVDVVGYSAGGVVARLWAEEDGGAAIARRIVTLGSPHHGTQVAALGASLLPGQCPTACTELVPNSDLLTRMNADETPAGPIWVSVWTEQDQIVTPATRRASTAPSTSRSSPSAPAPASTMAPSRPTAWSRRSSWPPSRPHPPPSPPGRCARLAPKPSGDGEPERVRHVGLRLVPGDERDRLTGGQLHRVGEGNGEMDRVEGPQWMRSHQLTGQGKGPPGVERQDGERTLAVHVEAIEQHPRASQPACAARSGHRAGEFDPGEFAGDDRHVPVQQELAQLGVLGFVVRYARTSAMVSA